MKHLIGFIVMLFLSIQVNGQINQIDSLGRKQGKWVSILDKSEKIPNFYYINLDSMRIYEYQRYMAVDSANLIIETAKITENYINGKRNGDFYIHFNDTVLFVNGNYKNDTLAGLLQYYWFDSNGEHVCEGVDFYTEGMPTYMSFKFYTDQTWFTKYNNKKKEEYVVFYSKEGKVESLVVFGKKPWVKKRSFSIYPEDNLFVIKFNNENREYFNSRLEYIRDEYWSTKRDNISFFGRLFDANYWYVLFNKNKLKKKYGLDIRIKLL